MAILGIILALGFFVLLFVSWKNGAKYSGFYHEIGVCGRWYATLSMNALLGGVIFAVVAVVMAVMSMTGMLDTLPEDMSLGQASPIGSALVMLLTAAIAVAIGLLMYLRVYKKCPEDLKSKFFWHMVMMMLDGNIRLAFFFLVFFGVAMYELHRPRAYEVDGKIVYAIPGEGKLYDTQGNHVGYVNDERTKAIMK